MRKASLVPSALMDARELAHDLSVSLATLWRMRADHKLPEPIKLTAQCLRWRRSDVETWLAARCPAQQQRPTGTNGEASAVRHPAIKQEVAR